MLQKRQSQAAGRRCSHLIDGSVVGLRQRRVPILLALGDADGEADDKGDCGHADRGNLDPFLFDHGVLLDDVVCEGGNEYTIFTILVEGDGVPPRCAAAVNKRERKAADCVVMLCRW